MIQHLLFDDTDLTSIKLHPEHKTWLNQWFKSQENDLQDGCISSSLCLISFIAEIILTNGSPKWDSNFTRVFD